MKRVASILSALVVRFRYLVVILAVSVIALAPTAFDRLYHDNSNESYFLENDPNLADFNQLIDLFGDNEYLLVGVSAPEGDRDVFTARTVAIIDEITRFLEDHQHVSKVRSLSKYEFTHNDNGILSTDDLLEGLSHNSITRQDLEQARSIILGEELALGTIVSRDLKRTVISARTTYIPNENDHKVAVVGDLLAYVTEKGYESQGYNIHLSGAPLIGERFETMTQKDMAWINPALLLVMVVVLFSVFRSFVATIIPLLSIAVTVVTTLGVQAVLGWPFTAVNSALIPTIIILSMSCTIHYLVEYIRKRRDGLDKRQAALNANSDLLLPIFFTCSTTFIGFLALSQTELSPVRQFALLAGISTAIIFIMTCVVLPAVTSVLPWNPRSRTRDDEHKERIGRVLASIPDFTFRHRFGISAAGVVLALASLYGASKVSVDANVANYFKDDSWVHEDLLWFDRNFKGMNNLEVIVDSGVPEGVKDPEFLQRVESFQGYLVGLEETGEAVSLVDFLKQINKALHSDDVANFTLPDSAEMAAQYLLLYENTGPDEDLSDLKDFDNRRLRITVPVVNMDASAMTALLNDIRHEINTNYEDLNIKITGGLVMTTAQNQYLNHGMYSSFAVALALISLVLLLIFRSVKYGLIALLPSVVPILLAASLATILGISMDLGTMVVGAMTIGIAVDDSIHLMSRYLSCRKVGRDVKEALNDALATSGRAVLVTSLVLVCGFSMMTFGSFMSYIYVGMFSAVIMAAALVGDMLFMPALLHVFDSTSEPKGQSAALEVTNEV